MDMSKWLIWLVRFGSTELDAANVEYTFEKKDVKFKYLRARDFKGVEDPCTAVVQLGVSPDKPKEGLDFFAKMCASRPDLPHLLATHDGMPYVKERLGDLKNAQYIVRPRDNGEIILFKLKEMLAAKAVG